MAGIRWIVSWCILAFVFALSACAHKPYVAELPSEFRLVREQLEIHTTFPLASRHRLVTELVQRREDVHELLGLPKSDEPIHVFLFDSTDEFEAFRDQRFGGFPQRRAFFVETDSDLAVFASWGDHVAEDLRHEVAHGYLHAVVPGLPLWLDEGLAEYFEVPRTEDGLNRPHVALLLEAMRSGRWKPDLARLERLQSPGQMTQTDYAESWAWVHWLLESNPEHRRLLRKHLARLRVTGTAPLLSIVVSRAVPGADGLLVKWLRRLTKQVSP